VRRTLPDGSARVTAVGASVLLHVQRATTLSLYQYPVPEVLIVPVRSYRSVCTERASCCGAFRSWTFPSLLTHCQPPYSPSVFVVFGGGCVLILSVFGEGLWSGPSKSSSLVLSLQGLPRSTASRPPLSKSLAEVGELSEKVRVAKRCCCLRICESFTSRSDAHAGTVTSVASTSTSNEQ
jgi:hypothetical protein